ncbi:alpha/beta hydrolase [Streptosporangium sp. 'caverna']|uniref:alpha/beta hydrolase n=1 Tax=Streptosporangium sp. 'caverna' TaxID=2202249 RepID=UPI000D7D4123|nr:alpha/beta hydrolase [Streptosporangium sp. 'caverna']AWS48588.1 esterase [Streptosporangium sp. 'caverna']
MGAQHVGDGSEEPAGVVLDPHVRRLVDASAAPPYLHQLGPADGRQALAEAQGHHALPSGVHAEFQVAPVGPSGLAGFWIFRPTGTTGPHPVVIYIHGGRWMLGDAQTHGQIVSRLVLSTGAAFVVPEYTRTPEARYPVALEECYALLSWTVEHSAELTLDGRRLAVAGDCAGAGIAAAMTLIAKQRGGPRIRAQLLYYPLTDPTCSGESHRRFGDIPLLSGEAVRWYWQQYTDDDLERAEPTVALLNATREDLAGLPEALIVTAEADVARDDGEQYARNLRAAGVAVTSTRYLGTVHDFVTLTALRDSPPTRAALQQGGAFLKETLLSRR